MRQLFSNAQDVFEFSHYFFDNVDIITTYCQNVAMLS